MKTISGRTKIAALFAAESSCRRRPASSLDSGFRRNDRRRNVAVICGRALGCFYFLLFPFYFLLASCGRAGGEDEPTLPTEADLIPSDVVDDEGSPGESASLRFDSQGKPHISYHDSSSKSLRYVHFVQTGPSSGGWLPETEVPVLDLNGLPTGDNRIIVGQDVDVGNASGTDGMGSYSRLMLDAADRPHIVYYDDDVKKLKYAWGTSEDRLAGKWNFATAYLDGSSAGIGKWVSGALDENLAIHVLYYDELNQKVRYAQWNRADWNPDVDGDTPPVVGEEVDTVGVGMQTSIVVTPSTAPNGPSRVYLIYYSAEDGNLRLAYRPVGDQGGWTIQVLDDLPPKENETPGDTIPEDVGRWASAIADSQGNLHISYHDKTGNDLKYLFHDVARQKSFPRFRRIVDFALKKIFVREERYIFSPEGTITGTTFSDIRLPEDLPEQMQTKQEGLQVTREWVGMMAENGSNVGTGFETSIALGPDDTPIISYRDASNGDLKLAVYTLRPDVRSDPARFLGYTSDVSWNVVKLDTPMIRGIWSSIDTFPGSTLSRWRIGVAYEGLERAEGVTLERRLMFSLFSPITLGLF